MYRPSYRPPFLFLLTGYVEDFHENLVHGDGIPGCFEKIEASGNTPEKYVPKTSQAHYCQRILNGNKQTYFFQLNTPLSNIRSFLPANVEYGIRLYIQEPSRFFVTTSSCNPVIKVDSVKIYLKCVLFKEPILNRIERKLLGGPLIYPFAADFVKSYSLENVREKTQTTGRRTDRPTQERTDDLS